MSSLFSKDLSIRKETTIDERLNERGISVRDFGAKGDGKADDTAAFNKALSYLNTNGGGILEVPSGTYLIYSTLSFYPKVTISGADRELTHLSMKSDAPLFDNKTGSIIRSAGLKRMSIQTVSTNYHAINVKAMNNSIFERLQINQAAKGILLDGAGQCYYNTFFDVKINYCNLGLELKNQANSNHFISCNFIDYQTAVLLTDGEGNSFTDCGFETFTTTGNTRRGFDLQANAFRNTITNSRFEQIDGYPIYSTNSHDNIVVCTTIYSGALTPSFRGIDGTGINNTIISTAGGSRLTNTVEVTGPDATFGQLTINGKTKTANGSTIIFQTYAADNTTLQQVARIYGSVDNPRFYINSPAIFYSAAGSNQFEQDISLIANGKGVNMKSANGTNYRMTINDDGNGLIGSSYMNMGLSGTTANRPTTNNYPGKPYFDTTLGKMVWFKTGTTWVDATGATV